MGDPGLVEPGEMVTAPKYFLPGKSTVEPEESRVATSVGLEAWSAR